MRPSIDDTMMAIAMALSLRATCYKAKVGCVLCDKQGRILSAAYNGVSRGEPHCNHETQWALPPGWTEEESYAAYLRQKYGKPVIAKGKEIIQFPYVCGGAIAPPGSDRCEAVHAETNALLQCRDPDLIYSAYCTAEPCFRCTKELLNTGCRRIVWARPYGPEPQAGELWQRRGREWLQLQAEPPAAQAGAEEA